MPETRKVFKSTLLAVLILNVLGLKAEDPTAGVALQLAEHRKAILSEISYHLKAEIPAAKLDPIQAELDLRFKLHKRDHDLVLDFTPGRRSMKTLTVNGAEPACRFINEHIVIPAQALKQGMNHLHFRFALGDMSLNRREDLLYTLFVPDRARTAFPCFDQPDLKGEFSVELVVPADWDAVANGPLLENVELADGRRRLSFAPSQALPTYLMAFAAGKLDRAEQTREGRTIHIFHQENDPKTLERNLPEIYEQVFASLDWMENYTGIAYPFEKYDLVLVPSFQYGGMEHSGATLYRASRLLLDEQATLEQKLSRAELIAHETAHMWFGDLVTMPWFDEVWLKEVFAGFMADKIVADMFPGLDHGLKFLLGHKPRALSVDRSAGTHAITQELENLADAGTLYGTIIYNKAPVVMRMLEHRVGPETLRRNLSAYLRDHAYGNAGWDPLIDKLAEKDPGLKEWSRRWVYEAGLPTIKVIRLTDGIQLLQLDELEGTRLWSQQIGIFFQYGEASKIMEIELEKARRTVSIPDQLRKPDLVLPAGNGMGYGRLLLDRESYAALLENPLRLPTPLQRGVAWLALWEGALEGQVRPLSLLQTLVRWIEAEDNELLLERLLADLPALYWRLLSTEEARAVAASLEERLWGEMMRRPEAKRMAFLDAYRRVASTSGSMQKLSAVLRRDLKIAGLNLSEQKELDLLLSLVPHSPPGLTRIAAECLDRWKSTDLRDQLVFLQPLFSSEPGDWLTFFRETLTQARNREREPWVQKALSLIHHPRRSNHTLDLLPQTLAMLPEIQQTGDIFFPITWLSETLWGHRSPQAAGMVRDFLENDTSLSEALRRKVLQSADYLLRFNRPEIARLEKTVSSLCTLPRPRNAANPDMMDRAADLIESEFSRQGWQVHSQIVPHDKGEARNLSVIWGKEQAPRLVIGAHYDVCGDTPGADDNASGVAVLLELAARLADLDPPVGMAVELTAYALEEPPYFGSEKMGSFVHARSLREQGIEVSLMISLDMVGFYADEHSFLGVIGRDRDKEMLERLSDELSPEILLGAQALPLPESRKGIDWSDHRNFWAHDYPALMLHVCPLDQNPHYHTPQDRPELLDYHRMLALARGLAALVQQRSAAEPNQVLE